MEKKIFQIESRNFEDVEKFERNLVNHKNFKDVEKF